MKKTFAIFLNTIPILLMIGMIPVVTNDYLLAFLYVVIIAIAFVFKKEKNEMLVFVFGFLFMIASEYLFVSTGVETFTRNSLFGLMPIWLPFLWGYGFVAIKRAGEILDK
jgi:hypothetical protein